MAAARAAAAMAAAVRAAAVRAAVRAPRPGPRVTSPESNRVPATASAVAGREPSLV